MWLLNLNDMRSPKIEILKNVARAESINDLKILLERERVPEVYREDGYCKIFRKGGPLEWYNYPSYDDEAFVYIGTLEDWLLTARSKWDQMILSIPDVSDLK